MNIRSPISLFTALVCLLFLLTGCGPKTTEPSTVQVEGSEPKTLELSDEQVEDIVQRSYQYVAMYNVNNKFALSQGGWNTINPDTELKDHTMQDIARPNNDSLYIIAMLDLRTEPFILDIPAFDSKYVSLMVTGYDHYVNVPMSTRRGDFAKPEKMLLYTARTEGFTGEPVEGVDRVFEASGDFVSAIFRVTPHGSEPERFERIKQQMHSVGLMTLSEYRGESAMPSTPSEFPAVGATDADVFSDNLLAVMQFVFNHTSFDPNYPADQGVLAAYKPLGIEPGKTYDPDQVAKIDSKKFRETAQNIQRQWFANLINPEISGPIEVHIHQPKDKAHPESVLAGSIIGPIGLPREEAIYPQVLPADGEPTNALNDYVVRMTADELPPALSFWSLTLYDLERGFFLPNEHKKYSVGENAGMKLNEEGGIEIYITAEKPEGVPAENWLPIERKDLGLSLQLRVYVPDLEKMKTWQAPKAEKLVN